MCAKKRKGKDEDLQHRPEKRLRKTKGTEKVVGRKQSKKQNTNLIREARSSKDKRGKMQMVLAPRDPVDVPDSDDSTLPLYASGGHEEPAVPNNNLPSREANLSEAESLTDLEEEENEDPAFSEIGPMRSDRPIVTDKWEKNETQALFLALNVNRDAIKFHFQGTGGGKDVKRRGWYDVAKYVNDTADTHRTIKQCRTKAAGYSQNAKDKYNKLRYQVSQTGRGKISKKLHLDATQMNALDYLRTEAVKGIPGIEESELGEKSSRKKPSENNLQLLWDPLRESKPDYANIKMERAGIPKNYAEKNKGRIAREAKGKRRKEYLKKMRKERKMDRVRAREIKEGRKREKEIRKDRRERKRKRKMEKKERKERRAKRRERRERKAEKKDRKAQ